ncbi:non-ribosomal peptide synthetase [Sphaerisporangium rubeum]|uniref:Amino acid adenylation domain-containing protein n=1 Tax=Sphaerisporangium rubeum TaxID=321317 RepID=A0A7X0IJJ0_9ACTN|nr:non-ribosomal peptide synthetase [Sphaerisporangium rubeum]MBB6474867.1 amino acid adenylation domain-containing protein [Sphaerisporangium rubeum]
MTTEITPATMPATMPVTTPAGSVTAEASAVQRGMWLTSRLDPGGARFTVCSASRLAGPLDVQALQESLDALVARHDILRARFAVAGDRLDLLVDPAASVPIETADLTGLPVDQAREEARHRAEHAAAVPFDLENGPLLRVLLLRTLPGEHVLVLTLHHAVCDGWSVKLLLEEWSRGYALRLSGAPIPAEPPPPPYWDHAEPPRDRLAADLAYWRGRLRGAAPLPLPPPLPGPRPGQEAAIHGFPVPPDLLDEVDELAARTGATRYAVLLAAFTTLMGRLCGTDDVCVGTTMATRETIESYDVIGPMFTTVVLREDLSGIRDFTGAVAATRETLLQALEHRAAPFENVLDAVRAGTRSTARNPLFNVFFEVDHEAESPMAARGLASEVFGVDHPAAKTDLMLAMRPTAGGMRGVLTYRTAACDPVMAAAIGDGYVALLRDATSRPGVPLRDLAVMSPEEETRVTELLPDGGKAELPDVCAHDLIGRQAARTPDAVAVRQLSAEATSLTYAELDGRANALACRLRERGVGPESRVAVLMRRSPDLVVAFLAVWKAGGAYVPVDPSFPLERARFLVRDSGAAVVLCDQELSATALALGPPVLDVTADPGLEPAGPPPAAGPGDICYVIYTSGSTGVPKGVLVEHRGLVNFLLWCVRRYARDGDGGTPLFSSVAFDMVVPDLFTPLLLGQTVHVVPEDVTPDRLGAVLASAAPYSFVKLTPGHLQLLSRQLTVEQARGLAELLVVGADSFPASVLREWRELDPGTPLLNEYGPTEASVADCVHEIPGAGAGAGTLPIGRPIPNTTIRVLDRHGHPVPTGVPGELYIGGDCVVRGYAGRPATTAAAFRPDPHGPPGARMYRTGDLGRWLPDGELEFLGRADHQVKVRGHRVEPGEIEAVLCRDPSVRQALVTVRPTPAGHDALVAYVVPADGHTVDTLRADGLREHCARVLPAYLVPGCVVAIPALPLNENGKVDRAALPEPSFGTNAESEPVTGPELDVAKVWAGVLGLEAGRVGRHDNFFELGGNSLLVLSVCDRLRRGLGLTVSFEDFLRTPTVAGVAASAAPDGGPRQAGGALTCLSPAGDGTPMVFVHPLGGTVFCYRHLITELYGTAPLYGLTLSSLLGGAAAEEDSLEALTGRYAEEIARTVTGPVAITGWSAGGLIAYETARRLRELGADVTSLVLIDPSPPEDHGHWRGHVREVRRIRSRLSLATEEEREAEFAAVIGSGLFRAMGIAPSTCRDYSLFPQDVLGIWERQLHLLGAYDPGSYDGPVTLLTSRESGPARRDELVRDWRRLATGPFHCREVDGDHLSMMRPPAVTSAAAALRDVLTHRRGDQT